MFLRRSIPLLRLILGALVLIAGSLMAPAVVAQEADYSVDIIPTGDAVAEVPDGSVRVTVTSADGSVDYGTCTLSMATKPAGCSVMAPAETTVSVALGESTLPEGVIVTAATQQYTTPAEKTQVGDVWFEFTWATDGNDGADAPEDVRELPATGAGRTGSGTSGMLATASGVLAIAALAGGVAARLARQR